jgi:hypothetical protein
MHFLPQCTRRVSKRSDLYIDHAILSRIPSRPSPWRCLHFPQLFELFIALHHADPDILLTGRERPEGAAQCSCIFLGSFLSRPHRNPLSIQVSFSDLTTSHLPQVPSLLPIKGPIAGWSSLGLAFFVPFRS